MNRPLPALGRARTAEAGPAGRAGRVSLTARRGPDGRTHLARQYAAYPFHVCRPHRVAGDPAGMATLYLQSIAGGMFEHDRLAMEIEAGAGAALHLTSQGATIVHAMTGGEAQLATMVVAGPDSIVELMPEATILFPGARLALDTVVHADPTAMVCVSEAFLAHDPAANGGRFAHVRSDVRLCGIDGRMLAQDRQAIAGDAFASLATDSARAYAGYASLQLWAPGRDLDRLRSAASAALSALPAIYGAASLLPGDCGIAVRILAPDGAALRGAWTAAWQATRLALYGARPQARRK